MRKGSEMDQEGDVLWGDLGLQWEETAQEQSHRETARA